LKVEHPFLSFLSDGGPASQSGAVSVYSSDRPGSSRGSGRSRGGSQCCGGYAPFGVSGPECVRGSLPTRCWSRAPGRRNASTLPVREGGHLPDSTGLLIHYYTIALQNSCHEAELSAWTCKELERGELAKAATAPGLVEFPTILRRERPSEAQSCGNYRDGQRRYPFFSPEELFCF